MNKNFKHDDDVVMNEMIRFPKLRVIDEKGEQVGFLDRDQALKLAEERGLDLVLITDKSDPPVCKIIDYGKFRYEKEKKQKEAKKKQKVIHLKEIQIKPKIGAHDLEVKIKHINEFLEGGDKVKVTIVFKGRENDFAPIFGDRIMKHVIEKTKEISVIEKYPSIFGGSMILILASNKK